MTDNQTLCFYAAVVVGFLVLLVVLSSRDERKWIDFRDAHHCRVTGRIGASNGIGFGSKGETVVTYVPSAVLWLCDDGQIYGRSE